MSKQQKKTTNKQTVSYNGEDFRAAFLRYSNGRLGMVLKTTGGQVHCSVSQNLPDHPIDRNNLFINHDNPGMLAAMMEAGVLRPTGRVVDCEHLAGVPECEVLEPWLQEAKEAEVIQ